MEKRAFLEQVLIDMIRKIEFFLSFNSSFFLVFETKSLQIINFLSFKEAEPIILEKEGIDRDGNHYYEKEVILDTDLKQAPKAASDIMELVREENQAYLRRLNRMREETLKRRMAALAHAQLGGYMGNAAPLVVAASLLPTDKEISEAVVNGRSASNEDLFGWIKPVSESRSTFEIQMPASPDTESDKPKREHFEIDSYDDEPSSSSSSSGEYFFFSISLLASN